MMKKISGMSLISLIIGVALSGIIFMSMGGVFSSSKANQSLVEAMDQLNELARGLQKNVYDLMTQAGTMVPNAGTGLNPTYVSAFVESNYPTSPGGVAPSDGLVLGYFNYNSVNTNLWIKTYGSALGIIRSCANVETGTTEDFRIILFTQTIAGQTGFYCAKQIWGQTATDAMANPITLIPPQNFDSVWVKFGVTSLYLGCYVDANPLHTLSGGCVQANGSLDSTYTSCSATYAVSSCQTLAQQNDYSLFAVQNCQGSTSTCDCCLGSSYISAIQYGASGNCTSPQQAGINANALYAINGALSKWVLPENLSSFTDYSTGNVMSTLNVPVIRYVFLIKSSDNVLATPTTQNFQIMDNSGTNQISRTGQNIYKLVAITIPLPNNTLRNSSS
jgi:type II secretory pathway pseudopilin PulG